MKSLARRVQCPWQCFSCKSLSSLTRKNSKVTSDIGLRRSSYTPACLLLPPANVLSVNHPALGRVVGIVYVHAISNVGPTRHEEPILLTRQLEEYKSKPCSFALFRNVYFPPTLIHRESLELTSDYGLDCNLMGLARKMYSTWYLALRHRT